MHRVREWSIEKESTLQVAGKSNVNAFTCSISSYSRRDTLLLTSNQKGGALGLHGELVLDIARFDCHHKLITSDLRKTLKWKQHPILRVKFLSLDKMPDVGQPNQTVPGWVEVELAGVKKLMQITFHFEKGDKDVLLMNGTQVFCFSDFKLQPPTKLAGTVKIKDEFEVAFRLHLKEVY